MRDFFMQWYGFHGLRILHPSQPRNGIETEANEVNEEEFLLRLLCSLLFKKSVKSVIRGPRAGGSICASSLHDEEVERFPAGGERQAELRGQRLD